MIDAGHRCAVCGTGCPLERAHIVPWRRSRQHLASDLICLCANCHERADNEKWGEKTLRQYKERPWVLRQNIVPHDGPTRLVECSFDIEFSAFDQKQERWLQHALASFLDISPGAIRIRDKEPGSTKVVLELPEDSAESLLAASQTRSSDLARYLFPLSLIGLRDVTDTHRLVESTLAAVRSWIEEGEYSRALFTIAALSQRVELGSHRALLDSVNKEAQAASTLDRIGSCLNDMRLDDAIHFAHTLNVDLPEHQLLLSALYAVVKAYKFIDRLEWEMSRAFEGLHFGELDNLNSKFDVAQQTFDELVDHARDDITRLIESMRTKSAAVALGSRFMQHLARRVEDMSARLSTLYHQTAEQGRRDLDTVHELWTVVMAVRKELERGDDNKRVATLILNFKYKSTWPRELQQVTDEDIAALVEELNELVDQVNDRIKNNYGHGAALLVRNYMNS